MWNKLYGYLIVKSHHCVTEAIISVKSRTTQLVFDKKQT